MLASLFILNQLKVRLTKRQVEYLRFIEFYYSTYHKFPTYKQIGQHFGGKVKSTIHETINCNGVSYRAKSYAKAKAGIYYDEPSTEEPTG